MDQGTDIEMVTQGRDTLQRHDSSTSREHNPPHHEQSLEPVDRGRAAWRLLIGAFVFEALLWGFPLSFGVFQNYYSQLPEFANQPYVSVIGTTASGISYMGAPIIIPMLRRWSKYRTHMIWGGWATCILGVLLSSFAQQVWTLILTQGIMYGVGFVIFYYPILGMVNEYWVARRGMAYGFLCSASGVAGIIMPFSLEALLSRYGRVVTLRAIAVGLAVLTGPLIPFLKGRLPVSEQSTTVKTDKGFLRVPLFWIYTVSNVTQGLAYFFPSLYLPSYATSLGLSSARGAWLLAIMSVAQVMGQLSFGYLSDRKLSLNILAAVSMAASAVAVLTLWGLGRSFATLAMFALVYGFFGAGYTALWGRMGTAVARDTTAAFAAFGTFNFGKGIGNVLTGPIGANLLNESVRLGSYAAGRYETVVVFAGSLLLASGVSLIFSCVPGWKLVTGPRR